MLYGAAVIHLEVVLAVLVVLAEVDPYRAINLIASAGVLVQDQVQLRIVLGLLVSFLHPLIVQIQLYYIQPTLLIPL
jgi:hypothetical protein